MNLPWYIPVIIAFLGGFLLGWQGCEREPEVVTETITERDTIRITETPEPITIKVPVPYEVVKYIPTEPDPPDFTLDQLRTYIDTALFDGLSLGYEIKTRGTLESAVFSPTFERETIYETTTVTNTIDNTKKLRGLYLGATIGGNKEQLGTLGIGAYYLNRKIIAGYNYNLVGEQHNITIARKLFGF